MRATFAFVLLWALAQNAGAATAPGTTISNTARAEFVVGGGQRSESSTATFITDAPSGVAPTDLLLDGRRIPSGVAGAGDRHDHVVDADAGDTHSFVVDDARFEVVAGVLRLRDGVRIEASNELSVAVEITVTDSFGLTYAEQFILDVAAQPVPAAPPACAAPDLRNADAIAAAAFSLCEASAGATVAQLNTPTPTATIAVDDPRFLVDGDGVLRLRPGVEIDFESEPVVPLTLIVTDGGAAVDTQFIASRSATATKRPKS